MAHAMEAFELGRLADRSVVIPAGHAHGSTREVRSMLVETHRQTLHATMPLRVSGPGTDRSVGAAACEGRAEGVAKSAKKVDRFAEELGL